MNKSDLMKQIDMAQYVYLNKICKNVVHRGTGRIIPYKNAVINFYPGSKLILGNEDLEIGVNKLDGSKAETYLRLYENAVWDIQETCSVNYGCTIEILADAILTSKKFTMNCNSTIVCKKAIDIGRDVMIARNVLIYDSDFHDIISEKGEILNPSEQVVIGDHVWLCSNSTVLKGSIIGKGSIVANNATVRGVYGENQVVNTQSSYPLKGKWRR